MEGRVNTGQQTTHVVAGLIRNEDQVLLVQQQGPSDSVPAWSVPGGVANPGELLSEALAREVREETGLEILDPGRLLYVAQVDHRPLEQRQTLIFVFTVAAWQGDLRPADPDGYVLEARFLPVAEAIAVLDAIPWPTMSEPLQAHLRGEVAPGALWCYRRRADGQAERVATS